jgi:type II secretory pathway component PulF
MQGAMRIPALGNYIRTMGLARMGWSLAMTLEAGMGARQSVAAALRSTHNVYFTRHAAQIDRTLAAGGEIHESLRQTAAFPAEFLDAAEVGEQSGQLPEAMAKLSSLYQERAVTSSGGLAVVGTIVTWSLVAVLLISLIFRVAMFYIGNINRALDMIP